MKSTSEPGGYLAIDAMRGVGAMIVVIAHCYIFWDEFYFWSGPPVVDLFFLLSGFVLAFAYEPRFNGGMTAGQFMLQRLVRLYPLYFLGIFLGALVQSFSLFDGDSNRAGIFLGQLVPQLFMLPSPDLNGSKDAYAFNVPAWTLFWEFIVNFIYILAWRWLKSTRILVGVVIACAVWLAASALYVGKVDMGPTWEYFWGGMPRVMLGFFGGVLLFRLAGSPRTVQTRTSLLALGPALILPFVCLPNTTKDMRAWLDLLIVMIVSPMIMVWARSFNPPRWLWPAFTTLGAMSYAMYILHWPILEAMERLAWRYPQLKTDWAPWSGVGILVLVLAVSIVAERYYDRPVRGYINAKLKARGKRRKMQQTPQVAAE